MLFRSMSPSPLPPHPFSSLHTRPPQRHLRADKHPSRARARTGESVALTLAMTNGALDLVVPAQPPESALALAGAATHAPVDARLPPAFEGAFVLDVPGVGSPRAVVDRRRATPRTAGASPVT